MDEDPVFDGLVRVEEGRGEGNGRSPESMDVSVGMVHTSEFEAELCLVG